MSPLLPDEVVRSQEWCRLRVGAHRPRDPQANAVKRQTCMQKRTNHPRGESHICMRARGGRQLSGAGSPQSEASPPSAVDPLPGRAWKEVTFSKVCLNRDDMWRCWHETPRSARYHRIGRRCQKSRRICFLSPLRFLSLSSLYLQTAARCQRKQSHCWFYWLLRSSGLSRLKIPVPRA